MLSQILQLLVDTTVTIYTMIVLLRFLLQWAKADFYNPISQFVVKASNPLLMPLRKFVPGFGGIDVASLVLAMLVQIAGLLVLMLVAGSLSLNPLFLIIYGVFGVLQELLTLLFFAIIIVVIVSWVAPGNYNPAAALLAQITEPVMAPFRKIIPPLGGMDFSPMIVLFVLHVLRSIVLPEILRAMF